MCDIAKANKIKPVLCSVLPCVRFRWRPEVTDSASQIVELNAMIKEYAANVTSLADGSDNLSIGGIVGYAEGHQEQYRGFNGTYIIACHNMGEIKSGISSAYSNTGGIAGALFGGAVVMACSNKGELKDENQYASIGSIVGYCSSDDPEYYYESSVLSCLYNSDEYMVTYGDYIERGNYSFADAELYELNYWIACFNELNYDYQNRTVVLDKHWEDENGSFVLKDGAVDLWN